MEQKKKVDSKYINGFSLYKNTNENNQFVIAQGTISAKHLMAWLVWNNEEYRNEKGFIPIQILQRKGEPEKCTMVVNDYYLKNGSEKVSSAEHSPDREIDLS